MQTLIEKYRNSIAWAPEGGSGGSSAAPPSSGGSGGSTSSGASAPSPAPNTPSGGSSSRATAAPSADRPSGAGEAPDSTDFSGDLNFDSIFGVEEAPPSGGEAPPPAPVAKPVAPVAAPPAAPVAAEAPAAAAPAAADSAGGQVAPGAGTPPAGASAPAVDPYNPGQLAQHLLGVESEATAFVAEQMFQLSAEDREAIETDVIGTIPKLLAKVFVKSQQNVLQQLDRLIPVMIQRHTEAMKQNTTGEDRFYDRWKNIGREHSALVNKYAGVYRQMHPNATLDQMIEDVGPMIMMAARIAPSFDGNAAPGQPARPANGRPPQAAPFIPAGSGGPVSQPKTQELTPWEAMFVGQQ